MGAEKERNAVREIEGERRFPSSGESSDSYIFEGIFVCWHPFGGRIRRPAYPLHTYILVDCQLL